MADQELAAKLSKRMALNGSVDFCLHWRPYTGHKRWDTSAVGEAGEAKPLSAQNERVRAEAEEVSAEASDELKARLCRRQDLNRETGPVLSGAAKSVYAEFFDIPRSRIRSIDATFRRFDLDTDGKLSLDELKRMMEVLGQPQTHLGLKAMLQEVDEDGDGALSFREFLLIFRKAGGEGLKEGSGLAAIANSIDVSEEGVIGAKVFFEAKIKQVTAKSDFEEEILKEQEQKRAAETEQRERRAEFQRKLSTFNATTP